MIKKFSPISLDFLDCEQIGFAANSTSGYIQEKYFIIPFPLCPWQKRVKPMFCSKCYPGPEGWDLLPEIFQKPLGMTCQWPLEYDENW